MTARKNYSQDIISQLPIRKLFLEARTNQEDYGDIYPMLLRLLVAQHRQLCMVDHWLKVEEMQEELMLSRNFELKSKQNIIKNESPVYIPTHIKQLLIAHDTAWKGKIV